MDAAQSLLHFLKATLNLPYPPVVAGGYARDRILGVKPRDIDVFLLNANGITQELSQRLRAEHIVHVIDAKEYPMTSGEKNPFDPAINFDFLGWPVQLIGTACKAPRDVVHTFDYNVCRFWLDDSGSPTYESEPTLQQLVRKEMKLMHLRTPWSSLRRGILMADRFGFDFNINDRRQLIKALYAEQLS